MKARYHLHKIRRDSGLCHYCHCNLNRGEATIDHVVPRALGGTPSRVNAVPACTDCNHAKGDSFPTCRCSHLGLLERATGRIGYSDWDNT